MAYNNEYPYFDPCNVNMDWLLAQMKELRETVLGLENVKFLGENPENDFNKLEMQSIAVYTAGNNAINSPMESAEGLLYTNGNHDYSVYQIFYDNDGNRWFRHYDKKWYAWKNMDYLNLSSYISNLGRITTTTQMDNAPNNSVYWCFATSEPVSGNIGMLITSADPSNTNNKLQLFVTFPNGQTFCRNYSSSGWSSWSPIPDLSSYIKYRGILTTSADDASPNSIYYLNGYNILGSARYGFLSTYIQNSISIQKADILDGLITFIRYKNSSNWGDWKVLYDIKDTIHTWSNTTIDANLVENNFFQYCNGVDNTPATAGYLFSFKAVNSNNRMQMFLQLNSANIFIRSGGSSWNSWISNATQTAYVAVASNISDPNSAPLALTNESTGEEIPEEIMPPPSTMFDDLNPSKWLRCPGQGLFAHDEDAQSFADAILLEDLSDIEYIVTNFEMYDMSLPLEEITTHVTVLADAIKNTYPLTELVIMGIPPIDVPFWGSEFFDYPMPNEITIRELDAKMEELALQYGFRYITWQDFDPIKIENLLDDHPDILQSSLYFKKLKGFVKSSVN